MRGHAYIETWRNVGDVYVQRYVRGAKRGRFKTWFKVDDEWMFRQTICLRLAVKGKYHNLRFSQYAGTEGDLLDAKEFRKKAFEYFGKMVGKWSGTGRTYTEDDILSHWPVDDETKFELGFEDLAKLMYEARAIGFEATTS